MKPNNTTLWAFNALGSEQNKLISVQAAKKIWNDDNFTVNGIIAIAELLKYLVKTTEGSEPIAEIEEYFEKVE